MSILYATGCITVLTAPKMTSVLRQNEQSVSTDSSPEDLSPILEREQELAFTLAFSTKRLVD